MLVALYHTTTIYTDPRLTTRLRTTKSILSIEELRQEVFRLGLDVFTEQVVANVVGIVEGVLDRVHVLKRSTTCYHFICSFQIQFNFKKFQKKNTHMQRFT